MFAKSESHYAIQTHRCLILSQRRGHLELNLRFQQLLRDATELDDWIADRIAIASMDNSTDTAQLMVSLPCLHLCF